MVQAQKAKKKRKSSVVDLINRMLEDADRARGGFSLQAVQAYYDKGLAARQKREPRLAEATPKLVRPKPESRKDKVMKLDQKMEEKAVVAAVDLATMIEMASTEGKKLRLREWAGA